MSLSSSTLSEVKTPNTTCTSDPFRNWVKTPEAPSVRVPVSFRTDRTCRNWNQPDCQQFYPCCYVEQKRHSHGHLYDVNGRWNFHMRAASIQSNGHSGMDGTCLGMESTQSWSQVVELYEKHKLDPYCVITATRGICAENAYGYSSRDQFIHLFTRCVGCDATDLPDWVACGQPSFLQCTGPNLKPGLASPEEIAATEIDLVKKHSV